jgi:hypothetical protein
MTAPTPPAQEPTTPPVPPVTAPEAPPWGADFDAEKAWSLVQNLRADKEKLAQRPVLTPEQQKQLGEFNALVEASKTEAQRLADATELARREAAEAKAEAIRYKAAATHGIPAEHFDLLGSGSEEEVAARAAKIAALLPKGTPPPPPAPGARPVEQLTPGATPANQPTDDELIYAKLFGTK